MTPQHNLTTLDELKLEFVRQVITARLLQYDGNQCKAADSLGIHRNTLRRIAGLCKINVNTMRVRVRAIRKYPKGVDGRQFNGPKVAAALELRAVV